MAETIQSAPKAAASRVTQKRAAKKLELTERALASLAHHGFAEAGLRKIASDLGVSLGVLHYHFDNKADILSQCMTLYKNRFLERIAATMAAGPDGLLERFAEGMADEIEQDTALHRLWYDIRSQALYLPELRPVVDQFETTFVIFAQSFLDVSGAKGLEADEVYRLFDGLFYAGVRDVSYGRGSARQDFLKGMQRLYQRIGASTGDST